MDPYVAPYTYKRQGSKFVEEGSEGQGVVPVGAQNLSIVLLSELLQAGTHSSGLCVLSGHQASCIYGLEIIVGQMLR